MRTLKIRFQDERNEEFYILFDVSDTWRNKKNNMQQQYSSNSDECLGCYELNICSLIAEMISDQFNEQQMERKNYDFCRELSNKWNKSPLNTYVKRFFHIFFSLFLWNEYFACYFHCWCWFCCFCFLFLVFIGVLVWTTFFSSFQTHYFCFKISTGI